MTRGRMPLPPCVRPAVADAAGTVNAVTKTFRQRAHETFVTADAVYGLILYSALIAASSDNDDEPIDVLLVSLITLVVFWAAHVFAATVAGHGVKGDQDTSLSAAFRHGVKHSSGMLYAAVVPSILLILGAFGLWSTETAVDYALLGATVVLGLLGYVAFAGRGARWPVRILGALGTALFGVIIIFMNVFVH